MGMPYSARPIRLRPSVSSERKPVESSCPLVKAFEEMRRSGTAGVRGDVSSDEMERRMLGKTLAIKSACQVRVTDHSPSLNKSKGSTVVFIVQELIQANEVCPQQW